MTARETRRRTGRRKGSGGRPELVRRRRVMVSLTEGDLARLKAIARCAGKPFSHVA